MISKMSLLVIWEILGVFVKRLTGDDNYPLWNCEDWRLPIQMKLSKNRKRFLRFLCHFWHLNQILNMLKNDHRLS